ncbi:transglycosylase family protein [Neomicrococcus lactis]|uniref:Sulfur carrier protein ThiS n=1 Tax=Neomicrococcus lactis TaxID=732241 RepID=A0A7W9DBU6_9MICC|nr:sulfur carrier protein ThiS [Neomicrococcus lactis]
MPGFTVVWNLVLHAAKNRWVKLSVQALVVLALIGGLFYVTSFQKTVALSVDGQERTVSMFGSTVADALTAANVTVGAEDQVSPALDAPIAAGQTINVLTEKGVEVSIDGSSRVVSTTGLTVEDLIKQLGIESGSKISLDENTPLTSLNSTLTITTADALADAAAEKAAAEKAEADKKVAAAKEAAAKKAAAKKAATAQAAAAAKKAEAAKVAEAARQAAAAQTAAAQTAAAKAAAAKETATREAAAKAATQTATATKAATQTAAAKETQAASSSSKTATAPTNVSGAWAALAQCESGGNWATNTGNGYYGGLQFSLSSWRAVGGTQYAAYPHQASASQQIAAAEKLRASGGWGHWPACSSKLGLR